MEDLVANGPFEGFYRGRRCLLTGHTGFKGSWLSLVLSRLGARVTGFSLPPPTQPSLFEVADVASHIAESNAGPEMDVTAFSALQRSVEQSRPEIVFHLAAQPIVRRSYEDPKETFDTNVGGTVNVLEAIRRTESVRAAVIVTTDKCYDNDDSGRTFRETDPLGGHDPYSASKGAAEIVAAAYARSFFAEGPAVIATARAGNVIGGGDWGADRLIPDAVRAVASGRALKVRCPDATRPWQHVLEPLHGYLALAQGLWERPDEFRGRSPHHHAFNLGPTLESCRSVREVLTAFLEELGRGEWLEETGWQNAGRHEAQALSLSIEKAARQLEWHPRWRFEEAVRRTAQWYRDTANGKAAVKACHEDIDAYWNADGTA